MVMRVRLGSSFCGSSFADDLGVRDLVATVLQDVVVGDWFECVSAVNAGFGWVYGISTHTLAQAAEFVGVRGVLDGFVFGVALQLEMAE